MALRLCWVLLGPGLWVSAQCECELLRAPGGARFIHIRGSELALGGASTEASWRSLGGEASLTSMLSAFIYENLPTEAFTPAHGLVG